MRTSQTTVACPLCGKAAVLTLTEFLTGPEAGGREFILTCPDNCEVDQATCATLWSAGDYSGERT